MIFFNLTNCFSVINQLIGQGRLKILRTVDGGEKGTPLKLAIKASVYAVIKIVLYTQANLHVD